MNYHWNFYLGKSVRNSLCASSGIGVATGTFHRWKNTLTAKKWHLRRQEIQNMIPYPPHGHPGTTLGVPEMPRSCCHGEPQGEQLLLRGCSPGKCPAWGREEGAVSQRGWEGQTAALSPPLCPMWHSQEWRGGRGLEKTRRGGEMLFEYLCLCLSVRIYFNAFYFLFKSILPLTVIGKGFSFPYLNGQSGNANKW